MYLGVTGTSMWTSMAEVAASTLVAEVAASDMATENGSTVGTWNAILASMWNAILAAARTGEQRPSSLLSSTRTGQQRKKMLCGMAATKPFATTTLIVDAWSSNGVQEEAS
jgi:antirestriction protein ArdC